MTRRVTRLSTQETRAVLREFDGDEAALAAEIVRLRREVQDLAYENSRLRATRPAYLPAPQPKQMPERPAPPRARGKHAPSWPPTIYG